MKAGPVSISLRNAGPDDAAAIAALHTASWRSTYRGMLPDAYLDGALAADKAAHWADKMVSLGPEDVVLAAEAEGRLVGFVAAWPDPAVVDGYFLDNLHADPGLRGRGIGRALMTALRDRITPRGARQMWLTVFPENAVAVGFYQRMGGQPGLLLTDEIGGNPCAAQAYYWLDLTRLGTGDRATGGA
ncbi:MAG: GNAT family N-acetyltransferase [Pseudomonadota bacterium]